MVGLSYLAIFVDYMRFDSTRIFNINNDAEFEQVALKAFQYQFENNDVYQKFCKHLKLDIKAVKTFGDIPFLPISFFKSKRVISTDKNIEAVFTSSGTTGVQTSKHHVSDLSIYEQSYRKAFDQFYGNMNDYCILALLPSYLEREGSSLIYMVDDLIKKSGHPKSGFYLNETNALIDTLKDLETKNMKTLLIGVSFALLDLAESYSLNLKNTLVMETGGMKGRRKEMIRSELHEVLKKGFGVSEIHSEYGMTELLSQAYSSGNGRFNCPPWMKVLTRDTEDPLSVQKNGKTGGINIIDLANFNSCAFIATQDLGKTFEDGSFEILGRFDHSDIRGCNLMVI
ncbi:acyl transferase [Croceitalea rosinachiae]|uniref:Acyl transferase n=1 Tax=Croceitalea rosinachiae TaxID=3075596 RepID=A0ABU3A9L9_9FLAO|nr:acyl transferase [Croceitalea sp. F388]MDT0606659.1 acyl transferase [Croceitalea sp. F388]